MLRGLPTEFMRGESTSMMSSSPEQHRPPGPLANLGGRRETLRGPVRASCRCALGVIEESDNGAVGLVLELINH
eukprot:scaffold57_cov254-Pinguiococcus_pyrenoidosus.AAC.39